MAFQIEVGEPEGEGGARVLRVSRDGGPPREYRLEGATQDACQDLFARFAADFGCRMPLSRRPVAAAPSDPRLQPLLTRNLTPDILYGYGDPSVLRDGDRWWLTVTSNDAPQSFPILSSRDLITWEPEGFVFPAGARPAWAMAGPGSDFWAPEAHRIGDEYWLCFTAREHGGRLAIGLAKADRPGGPYVAPERPLLGGDVIDAHILPDPEGPILYWKEDSNGHWPGPLGRLLFEREDLLPRLLPDAEDQVTGEIARALHVWSETLGPMEQFCLRQLLIEAVTEDFADFRGRLEALSGEIGPLADVVLEALTTTVYAQRLAPDGSALVGERVAVLRNDLPWEAHLIEGMWITRAGGRCWMFYSGNDFSTAQYGIGVAVADSPFGPFHKQPEPFLRSTADWWGPGHASVGVGPEGEPRLFLHAFRPGEMGYKVFRALLTAPITFEDGTVRLADRPIRGVAGGISGR
ncbi:family 43 glycosylhydrolase [Phenylobacterium sp.]|uniref:family 43 glycosylhydrolase n=1 Tax=Phenylobacterium sp. TaxID=1871053 RepID=UPI002FE2D98F